MQIIRLGVTGISKIIIICISLCIIFSMFGCKSNSSTELSSLNNDSHSIINDTQESSNSFKPPIINETPFKAKNSIYFTDNMPLLTPSEMEIVDELVPEEILYDFTHYKCFPYDKIEIEDGLTYGMLWRYIGNDGMVKLGGNGTLRRNLDDDIDYIYPRIFPYLKSIDKLYIDLGMRISPEEFPVKDVAKMTWLTELGIGNLDAFPEGFSNLTNLKYLAINFAGELPDTFESYENLEVLILNFNRLSELPPSLFDLCNLKELHLSGNYLRTLPKEILNLKNLIYLDLRGNPFEEIPAELCKLDKLEELLLNGSNRAYLGREPENLLKLAKSLPENFGDMTSLKKLWISNFPITNLPYSFGNLTALEELNLYLPLETLPDSFSNLSNLKIYTLAGGNSETSKELHKLAKQLLENN